MSVGAADGIRRRRSGIIGANALQIGSIDLPDAADLLGLEGTAPTEIRDATWRFTKNRSGDVDGDEEFHVPRSHKRGRQLVAV